MTDEVTYNYEAWIQRGPKRGTIVVPEKATREDILLAIIDDLFNIVYERKQEQ